MDFCTAISCMDGRIQLPVFKYLQQRFNVRYVDTITEPGPNRILAFQQPIEIVETIKRRVDISVYQHHSVGIAIVGHDDCAGNPASPSEQWSHLQQAVGWLHQIYPEIPVIALWVDKTWRVQELPL